MQAEPLRRLSREWTAFAEAAGADRLRDAGDRDRPYGLPGSTQRALRRLRDAGAVTFDGGPPLTFRCHFH